VTAYSDVNDRIERQRNEVTVSRARAAEARRSLSSGRSSEAVEASALAQARLLAAERRLALMEWERDVDLFTSRAMTDGFLMDDRLVRMTHRVSGGGPCPECVSAGSLIVRGQKPPVGWAPSCGEPFDGYRSDDSGVSARPA
jgi:hypothetical protein